MKNFIIGIIFSFVPVYVFSAWTYVFYSNLELSQPEKVEEFNRYLFNTNIDYNLLTFINVVLSLLAIFYFWKSMTKENLALNTISLILALVLLIAFNFWGML